MSARPIPFAESLASMLAECKRRAPDFVIEIRTRGQDLLVAASCTIDGERFVLSEFIPPQQSAEACKRRVLEACLRSPCMRSPRLVVT